MKQCDFLRVGRQFGSDSAGLPAKFIHHFINLLIPFAVPGPGRRQWFSARESMFISQHFWSLLFVTIWFKIIFY